jgi:hypothetical protein
MSDDLGSSKGRGGLEFLNVFVDLAPYMAGAAWTCFRMKELGIDLEPRMALARR